MMPGHAKLTLFRPEVMGGGGRGKVIVPALTLDVYCLFNKQTEAAKLANFS